MTRDELVLKIKELESELTKCNVEANTKKILNNGSFGKLGSIYSIFYAPTELLQVTLTGQLALIMLIEQLELAGIPVVSANTDGIVINPRRDQEWLADQIIQDWEAITNFETERTDYTMLASRDVNSYIAIKTDGEVKLKGAFAPAEPGPSGWPNPTGQICVEAAVAYLKDGTPIDKTIRACTDFAQFIYARAVRGGGILNKRPLIPKQTSMKNKRALMEHYGFGDYEALRAWSLNDTDYLGKIVRWYYAKDSTAWIQYKTSGNMVPRSQGCRPCMDLPDEFPEDIDYTWYITETRELLKDMGVSL